VTTVLLLPLEIKMEFICGTSMEMSALNLLIKLRKNLRIPLMLMEMGMILKKKSTLKNLDLEVF